MKRAIIIAAALLSGCTTFQTPDPEPRFWHPYDGKLVIQHDSLAHINNFCRYSQDIPEGWRDSVFAASCAWTAPGSRECLIMIPYAGDVGKQRADYLTALETANCNKIQSWPVKPVGVIQ